MPTPPSPRKSSPSIQWAVMGLSPSSTKPVLYRTATSPQLAKELVHTAIIDGATIIILRQIHLPPEGKPLDDTPKSPPDGKESEKAS